jgi:hypothetical protein
MMAYNIRNLWVSGLHSSSHILKSSFPNWVCFCPLEALYNVMKVENP